MVLRYLSIYATIIVNHPEKRSHMKNAHKIFLLLTFLTYVLMYGVMALLS